MFAKQVKPSFLTLIPHRKMKILREVLQLLNNISEWVHVSSCISGGNFQVLVVPNFLNYLFNFLRIWSHLLKKSLMENFIFCPLRRIYNPVKYLRWRFWAKIVNSFQPLFLQKSAIADVRVGSKYVSNLYASNLIYLVKAEISRPSQVNYKRVFAEITVFSPNFQV